MQPHTYIYYRDKDSDIFRFPTGNLDEGMFWCEGSWRHGTGFYKVSELDSPVELTPVEAADFLEANGIKE